MEHPDPDRIRITADQLEELGDPLCEWLREVADVLETSNKQKLEEPSRLLRTVQADYYAPCKIWP